MNNYGMCGNIWWYSRDAKRNDRFFDSLTTAFIPVLKRYKSKFFSFKTI